ncbi:MAG: hypothetical protein ACKVOP_06230 [Sphingomonadaceae bacterium]
MGMLDGLLGQITGNMDVANLATKVGLSPEQAEAAISALGLAHPEPGDTVATAAANTGLSPDILQQIVGHIGGEGSLGQYAQMIAGAQSEGGIMDTLGGLASGLMGGDKK